MTDNTFPQIVIESAQFCNLRPTSFMRKPWPYQHECMLEAVSANACGISQVQYSTLTAAQAMNCCLKAGQWPAACTQLTGAETTAVLPALPAKDPSVPPKPVSSLVVHKFVPEPTWATHDRPLVQSRATYVAEHPPSLAPSSTVANYGLGFLVVLALSAVLAVLIVRRRDAR